MKDRTPLRPVGTRSLVAVLIVGLTWFLPGTVAVGQEGDRDAVAALQRSIVDVIAEAERSVVAIARSAILQQPQAKQKQQNALQRLEQLRRQRAGQPAVADPLAALRKPAPTLPPHAFGAGVVIGEGLVLTQYLVVKTNEAHTVTTIDGDTHAARILASDPRSGLAVLSLTDSGGAEPPALPIGRAEDLRKGAFVVAIGNPFAIQSDGQPTASWGTIANTARKAPPGENLNNVVDAEGTYRTTLHHFGSLIQTDARLGWNASGGALVTLDGELIGVTTTASTIAGHERPAGYAIPLNELIRRVLDDLRAGREPEYGLLGLTFDRNPTISPRTGEPGIGVSGTFRGSPAARAGLQRGDLILSIDGRRTFDADSLQLVVSGVAPGEEADVAFERAGQTASTPLVMGKAFVNGERVVTTHPPSWRGMRVDFATAVPSNVLQSVAEEGKIDPEGCVVVSHVEEGSSAWQSGVRPYSYISHIDGNRVATPEEFYAAVDGVPESVSVRFTKPLLAPGLDPAMAEENPLAPPQPFPLRAAPNRPNDALQQERRRLFREIEQLIEPLEIEPEAPEIDLDELLED